jgi:NhaP-type Na+/H+ or K+/H+ antiporter
LIAGVSIGVQVIDFTHIVLGDEVYIAIMIYFVCIFARFFSITCFIKWLQNLGYGMTMKEAFIIAFTGLKGAIGISLAMLVYENHYYA